MSQTEWFSKLKSHTYAWRVVHTALFKSEQLLISLEIVFLPFASNCISFVTGFWKTANRIVTLGLFHFIGPANGYTCTLHIHSAINSLGWLVCFSRVSFADPANSWLRQYNGTHGGRYMEGMGLKFPPVIGQRLLRHSRMFGLALLGTKS